MSCFDYDKDLDKEYVGQQRPCGYCKGEGVVGDDLLTIKTVNIPLGTVTVWWLCANCVIPYSREAHGTGSF